MVRLALGLWFAISFAGCGDPDEVAATIVCDAICDCTALVPSQHEACVAECEGQLPGPIPDDCLACAAEDSCPLLVSCFDTCADVPEDI